MELNEEEKEAIEILKKLQKKTPYIIWGDGTPYNKSNQIQTILNLIDKYQKEIEKFKWKPISEYNRKEYDWVLVKYFDGDYECVPNVAEMRNDGKWYTYEKEIPFEVKYFFDMQELLEE